MKKILVVDDESSIVDVVVYALRKEKFETDSAKTGEAAVDKVRSNCFDVVILDIILPDVNGFEVCRRIRSFSQVPIIMLSSRDEEIDRIVGLEIGADDYVTKPFAPRELVARVKAILRRAVGEPPAKADSKEVYRYGTFSVDKGKARITCDGELLPLSKVEFNILEVLLRTPGRVFSREDLLDLAWGKDYIATDRTIDTHIKTIRRKIHDADGDKNVIETKRGMGYCLKETARG